ncbi:MAG: amidase family protein, partial [Solirubrobacterales bacterium]
TDSGGSIRIPAAWCRVVGFKPSHGLVSMDGCFPLAPSFDTAGPMARDVRTCVEMMKALVPGFEGEHLGSLDELRVGVVGDLDLDRSERVELPSHGGAYPVFMREVAETHAELFAEHRGLYGDNVATKVERCLAVADADYERARRCRNELRERFGDLLERVELLITPTVPLAPPPAEVDELEVREEAIRFTLPFNVVGAPALALPNPAGGPGGSLQIVAAPGRDGLVLAAAELLERRLARSA